MYNVRLRQQFVVCTAYRKLVENHLEKVKSSLNSKPNPNFKFAV